jgi:hypothetical protein
MPFKHAPAAPIHNLSRVVARPIRSYGLPPSDGVDRAGNWLLLKSACYSVGRIGFGVRWFLSLFISFILSSVAAYSISNCKRSDLSIPRALTFHADLIHNKEVWGPLVMASTVVSMPIYDVMALIGVLCGWDEELQDLRLRSGGPWVPGNAPPFPRKAKFALYPLFCSFAIYIIAHGLPFTICRILTSNYQ